MDSDTFWNKSEVVFFISDLFQVASLLHESQRQKRDFKTICGMLPKKKALCGDLVKIGAELAF